MKPLRLGHADREFLALAASAAFANPFSEERERVDRAIAAVGPSARRPETVDRMLAALAARLASLEQRDKLHLARYTGDDRRTLATALLFHHYHCCVNDMDAHIRAQLAAGDEPVAAPFSRDALATLQKSGFSNEEATRYFGLFFQLRRAFYFIRDALIGESPSMHTLRRSLWNNVFTADVRWYDRHLWRRMEDFSTLLLGETGTGKGACAAAIGRSGFIPFDERTQRFAESFTRAFIPINLSQFPESLIESELFGHQKGAFTGAIESHDGVFARCSRHGATFLDEIGDVSVPVQIKLLQVLQERTFSPVGSHKTLRFEGRVIAATNKPLDALRAREVFREDFFYRLCSDVITVPPLRERLAECPGELDTLVAHLVRRMTDAPAPELCTLALDTLRACLPEDYRWPGNVRELEQAVRRIILTRSYTADAAPQPEDPAARFVRGIAEQTHTARDLLAGYCRQILARHGTFEEVARRTGLDRRTARKYATLATQEQRP